MTMRTALEAAEHWLPAEVAEWWRARKDAKRKEKALKQFGWDGKCRACDRWHHADDAGRLEAETPTHWHYRCDCGHLNSYALWGPLPIADEEASRRALDPKTSPRSAGRG